MKLLRIFVKPTGCAVCDVPLINGATIPALYDAWKRDGAAVSDQWIVPVDSILYALTFEVPEGNSKPSVPFLKPVS